MHSKHASDWGDSFYLWNLSVTCAFCPSHACSPAGQYSGAGAEACTPCPAGQYSPTTGMADQEVNSNKVHCLRCPVGSIALTNGVSIPDEATAIDTSATGDYRNGKGLLIGADHCEAW